MPKIFAPRDVPARLLPVPDTVSPGLQAIIAAPPNADARVVPDSLDAWRRWVSEKDGPAAALVQQVAADLKVSLTPVTIAGVAAFRVVPPEIASGNEGRLLVHLHGGSYAYNAGLAAAGEAVLIAWASKTEALSIDYRQLPDHPFPAGLDDAVAVWSQLVKERDPRTLALFGSSAGGGLVMATVLSLKQKGLPLPAALFLGSPWSDLSKTGDSYAANENVDNAIVTYDGNLGAAAALYAGGRDLKEPLLSPVYGDLSGFPPTLLYSGTRDLFLSNTVRVHRLLRQAGVRADLHVFEGQSHVEYLTCWPAPEAREAVAEVAAFFDRHLAR